jgi:RimJ/RimL family protein N-acetyltransferase
MIRLETERLWLTPIAVADAAEMSRVLADPALYAFTGGAPEAEAALAVRYARWVAGPTEAGQRWVNLVVRERSTGQAAGYVQATVEAPEADLAWVIGAPWQRRGYAVEATRALVSHLARELGVATLRALIRPDHAASQAVARRLGLVRAPAQVRGEDAWVGPARGGVVQ